MSRVYLDYASTTPLDKRVLKAMKPFLMAGFDGGFCNASSLYKEGVFVSKKILEARKSVADIIGGHSDEIFFTSGGTESNNLAIMGMVRGILAISNSNNVVDSSDLAKVKPHIVTSNIEHSSVLETCRALENQGIVEVTYISVSEDGLVDIGEIKKSIRPETILISIMYVNNEVGTIQPIKDIAKLIRAERKNREEGLPIYFHTDASQAALFCNLGVPQLGIDLMTLDASKIYGPKGSGVLFVHRNAQKNILPIIYGGGQENGLRSGTENPAAIVGFAEALRIAISENSKESLRILELRSYCLEKLKNVSEKSEMSNRFNFSLNVPIDNPDVAPNFLSICLKSSKKNSDSNLDLIDAEFIVLQLDVKGVSISSVSSCKISSEDSSSYVIEALGKNECAKSSLRISLGRFTTKKDIDLFVKAIAKIIF